MQQTGICLPEAREAVSWEKVLRLLVVNRLLDPVSEFHVHRQWFVDSAMDELLETYFAVAEKDRLYRCLDRICPTFAETARRSPRSSRFLRTSAAKPNSRYCAIHRCAVRYGMPAARATECEGLVLLKVRLD